MKNLLRAFLLGVRDGWQQPHSLSSSANVDHLFDPKSEDVYTAQDRGINIGQILRAGPRSEAWRLRYWPLPNDREQIKAGIEDGSLDC